MGLVLCGFFLACEASFFWFNEPEGACPDRVNAEVPIYSKGKLNETEVPFPAALSIFISPPISRARLCMLLSPRPTPLSIFDSARDEPAILSPQQPVRFRSIGREDFDRLLKVPL